MPKLVGKWKGLEQLLMKSKPSSSFVEMVTRISLSSKRFCSLRMAGSIKKEDTTAILQSLIVDNCVGFEADEEIFKKASGIELLRHEGCGLLDQFAYDTDECDPLDLLIL
ncbi:hypothetical protein ZIOFF_069480 [Zingiber officinale]|uniref:Uncharacterized protein n=1 Tax=Zingiber officinale TaxID=94328 RepID=A0A8J5EPY3_ZINOF|nr:hypothetical protein ZIOFF_069480 [Zingiber officinale]